MSLRVRLAMRLLGTSLGKGDYDDGYAAALRDARRAPLADPVQDATDRLMNALALHEDSRDTVESVLADLYGQSPGEWIEPHPGEGNPDWRPSDPRCSACGHPVTDGQAAAETDDGGVVHLFGCPDGTTSAPTATSDADAAGWDDPLPASVYGSAER